MKPWGRNVRLRARSHGCKIWLKVGGALQFPWTLQRNLAAAARSAKKREAARRAAFRFFALQLQKLQRSRSMRENARSCSFGWFFFFGKRTFSEHADVFRVVLKFPFFLFFCWWRMPHFFLGILQRSLRTKKNDAHTCSSCLCCRLHFLGHRFKTWLLGGQQVFL